MNVAVLVSGNGTNLQSLIDAQRRGELDPAVLKLVISNAAKAPALDRARRAELPALVVDHREFLSREDFELALLDELTDRDIDAIVLAGFMRVLTSTFVARFKNRIINTHPALLPAFPGVGAPGQAIEYGAKVSGCTVHLVDEGVDTGPIIMQAAVTVEPDDDSAALHDRIRAHEHRLLPTAVQLLAAGRIQLDGRRVTILDG